MENMIEKIYTSTNCNQTPTANHWGKNKLICYASCNSVQVYDPNAGSGGKIINTLVSHTKRVNSVRWLSGPDVDHETELVSGSTDGNVIVWTLKGVDYHPTVLQDHTLNVNIVDGLYKSKNKCDAVIVSASMDSTIKVWYRQDLMGTFSLAQTINLGYGICMGLRLSLFEEENKVILGTGMDNSKIQLFVENSDVNNMFINPTTLAGHVDWVRGLDFTLDGKGDLLLATCSQDAFIRLWRILKNLPNVANKEIQYLPMNDSKYIIMLESVLAGHEGWIYSVNWSPKCLQILSASIDKTMIIWEYDSPSSLWLEKIRVGEVGGNTLGFYQGVFSPDGNSVLAHSYHGAFHIWRSNEQGAWEPAVTLGGHFNEVVDMVWDPKGEFLMSVSYDQTTRVHAPWQKNTDEKVTWHEIARPQVHGYDMSCIAIISRYMFASGAEEKVIRTFEAPKNFVQNFRRICKIKDDPEGNLISNIADCGPQGASVPSLGLSNKAVFTNDNIEDAKAVDSKNPYPEESHFKATDMMEPPTEETLLQNTLWPEVQKLYGHGYEVYSLAASPDGKYLASACKSTTAEHAAVLLWDTKTWTLLHKLMSHTLTIAQMQFSPDSNHLLTVSRDRRWSLFTKNSNEQFELVATTDKKTSIHTRIIWCCGWSHDSKYFVTGSRDGKIVVWTRNEGKEKSTVLGEYEAASVPLELKGQSVTALSFAPDFVSNNDYLVAVGLETGVISLYRWNLKGFTPVLELPKSIAHHLTVKRLLFRPVFGEAGYKTVNKNILQLASCSSDCSVNIYNIDTNKI